MMPDRLRVAFQARRSQTSTGAGLTSVAPMALAPAPTEAANQHAPGGAMSADLHPTCLASPATWAIDLGQENVSGE